MDPAAVRTHRTGLVARRRGFCGLSPGTPHRRARRRHDRGGAAAIDAAEETAVTRPEPAAEAAPHPADPAGLGERIVGTELYRAQRQFVRGVQDAKGDRAVAAALDALAAAGGKLSPGAVAAAAQAATGRSQRNAERFATVLERLLNIDGYPVLQLVESGRTVQLNKALLEEQFLGDAG